MSSSVLTAAGDRINESNRCENRKAIVSFVKERHQSSPHLLLLLHLNSIRVNLLASLHLLLLTDFPSLLREQCPQKLHIYHHLSASSNVRTAAAQPLFALQPTILYRITLWVYLILLTYKLRSNCIHSQPYMMSTNVSFLLALPPAPHNKKSVVFKNKINPPLPHARTLTLSETSDSKSASRGRCQINKLNQNY